MQTNQPLTTTSNPNSHGEARQRAGGVRREAIAAQALTKAVSSQSTMNYQAILEGFAKRGVPLDQIIPRQNIFTFHAWRALGRTVRKGEKGVRVVTWVPMVEKPKHEGEEPKQRNAGMVTYVFHISQTDEISKPSH